LNQLRRHGSAVPEELVEIVPATRSAALRLFALEVHEGIQLGRKDRPVGVVPSVCRARHANTSAPLVGALTRTGRSETDRGNEEIIVA